MVQVQWRSLFIVICNFKIIIYLKKDTINIVMDIIVMGSGVIGVTTAYMLAKDGHNVKVIDSASEAARGTSYANGAQLSFSHIEPVSSSGSLKQMIKALIKLNSFLSLNRIDKNLFRFVSGLVKNSGEKSCAKIAKNLFSISRLSRNIFQKLLQEEKIEFNYSQNGTLHIFRNDKSFETAKAFSRFQNSIGDESEVLNLTECLEKEPTLVKIIDDKTLKGGIFHPQDASGDPYLFCNNLVKICREKYNVEFIFDEKIKNILTNSAKITGVNCVNQVHVADKYIYAMGVSGLPLLKGINIDSKIFPVLGNSISVKIGEDNIAPRIPLTDSENRMVYSRIGDVFRAAGTAYLEKSQKTNEKMNNFIKRTISSTFSDYGDLSSAVTWQNYRPLRHDSTPLICNVEKYDNLYLNTGHGHLGWTMSLGSAEIMRRLILKEDMGEFTFLGRSF